MVSRANAYSMHALGVVEPLAATGRNRSALDRIDLKILAALQRDGRISKSALAREVNLSPSACYERMTRLEKLKLIQSYHANINFRAIMQLQTFLTSIVLRSHYAATFRLFESYVAKVPEIIECQALGGGIDYIIKVVAHDVEEYEALIQRMLDAEIGIERYFTYIVTKSVKNFHQFELANLL